MCCIRIYLPREEQDAPVVVCSELPANDGASITYAAEPLVTEVVLTSLPDEPPSLASVFDTRKSALELAAASALRILSYKYATIIRRR
jgi:hypothetical protein